MRDIKNTTPASMDWADLASLGLCAGRNKAGSENNNIHAVACSSIVIHLFEYHAFFIMPSDKPLNFYKNLLL